MTRKQLFQKLKLICDPLFQTLTALLSVINLQKLYWSSSDYFRGRRKQSSLNRLKLNISFCAASATSTPTEWRNGLWSGLEQLLRAPTSKGPPMNL